LRKKITVVGSGNVGTTTAQLIAEKDLADVVLVDIVEGIPQGKALDIQEACPLWGSSSKVIGTNSYEDTAGSDIVVITAGLARKPGMSRDDLLQANAKIIKDVSKSAADVSPDAIFIMVTNPMDVMAHLAQSVTGIPHKRMIGMGGVLDSSRMKSFIVMETGASPDDVENMVLGGHGDQMVPVKSLTKVKGKVITEALSGERVDAIIERTKFGGAEIVSLLKTGSAYFAPGASVVEMIEVIFGHKDKTLPCSVYLDGEYGIKGVYLGVPVKLSAEGIEEIVELELTDEEKKALDVSAESVRGLITGLGI
jgi:malate dehydrogenase